MALGRSGVAKSKTGLARLLWPVLLRKVEAELAADTVVTPVLTLVLAVRQKVAMLSGPGYALRTP